jgi:hypothetical protein
MKQFTVIFVSYDQSFGLLTSDLARALSLWKTSQGNSLRMGMEGA